MSHICFSIGILASKQCDVLVSHVICSNPLLKLVFQKFNEFFKLKIFETFIKNIESAVMFNNIILENSA